LSEFVWNKPVLSFYRENNEQPEREAFAVVKAQKLTVTEKDGFNCKIEVFFPLMGDVDQVQPDKKYVICWFDDAVEDFYAGFRRLTGVTFQDKLNFTVDKRNKKTYNALFQAKHAKLK
jgi:hypothetical protein